MASVDKIKIDGYKVFYRYMIDGVITIVVNSQDQFEAGQVDITGGQNILTESQAVEARNSKTHKIPWSVSYAESWRRELQKNGFDLESE